MSRRAETWKPIPGFDGYEASTEGRIRSWLSKAATRPPGRRKEPRILSPGIVRDGYLSINLSTGRGTRARQHQRINRLVLLAFVGPPPTPEHHASHLNDERTDNRLRNLSWETPQQNLLRKGL